MTLDELRKEFADAVRQKTLDVDRILALSAELARKDEDFVRFSADAALISRLGRELVARHETAVAELIKNAYDADAKQVKLLFENSDHTGGQLMVDDDGIGMTREQLVDGFMRLSSTDKIVHPYSPRYCRRRAGRKGIGRFAVQRLGEGLQITTQVRESESALRVTINWNDFTGGRDLASIANRIESVPKERLEGTTLTILGLREGWTEAAIRRVYRYVAELLQPFPLQSESTLPIPSGTNRCFADPGFKATLIRKSEGQEQVVADEETQVFSHALAEFSAHVDESGFGYWSIKSERLGIDEIDHFIGKERESKKPFDVLRGVALKAYYFIFETGLIPKAVFGSVREMASQRGGIRVYRNGFRVLPYGEREDDWLGLDASTSVRAILPPHANSNFFGFVEIVDPQGLHFEETSSREGLLENLAFEELQDFATRVLKVAVLRVAEARGRKQTAGQKDWQREVRDPTDVVRSAAKRLVAVAADIERELTRNRETKTLSPVEQGVSKAAIQLAEELRAAAAGIEERENSRLEEIGMLRVLASLGLTIGEFTHEVRQTLGSANLNVRQLVRNLPADGLGQQIASDLSANIDRIKSYASYFDRAVSENASRQLASQDAAHLLREFAQTVAPAAKRSKVEINIEISGYDLNTCPMHASEWASIFFNLYSNAVKAIKRANSKGCILIRVGRDDDRIYLEFADNGDGIPPENRDRIFNAFFTTSTPIGVNANEIEELQGTGLGLKIVKDIAESYGGEVVLTTPPDGYATSFRVEVPGLDTSEEGEDDAS